MKKTTVAILKHQKYEKLTEFFQGKKSYARTKDLRNSGFHQRDIKLMVDDGHLIKVKNGLFRHSDTPLISNQGFIDISFAVPDGVICLLSALSYYELTTFNPTFISIALSRNAWKPQIEYPPVEFFYFSEKQFEAGIVEVKIDNFNVRIYCPEKTVCDCFRLRHKLGLDIAKEGLTEYLKKKNRDLEKLLKYAEVCRVKQLIETWLNALV
ncbi:MAG: Abortive infection protein AbiEi [bacterium]|nr:Abortive infection protein AbiEi [bacterium]